jgi:RNA polymerase sigma factor (sigma-70 family)
MRSSTVSPTVERQLAAPVSIEQLAREALAGQRESVEGLLRTLQPIVFRLAVRVLWRRQDAEDATQEILLRVLTRLSQFDFRSRLVTWVYRVATNYLMDVKRSCVERAQLNFDDFAIDLAEGLSDTGPPDTERSILTAEVKVGCTLGMLQCLDRPHRLAYILGEILELPAPDAASALDLAPAAFRKRLQRARQAIETFTAAHCGLVSDAATCRCHKRVSAAIKLGRVQADAPMFASHATSFVEVRALIRQVEQAKWTVAAQRADDPVSRTDVVRSILPSLEPAG